MRRRPARALGRERRVSVEEQRQSWEGCAVIYTARWFREDGEKKEKRRGDKDERGGREEGIYTREEGLRLEAWNSPFA